MNGRIALTAHVYINKVSLFHLQRLLLHGQLPHPALAEGHARRLQRTEQTARRLRRALQGPKVHDGLVVGRSLSRWQQRLRQQGKLLLPLGAVDGCGDAEVTRQNPIDIAVDNGSGQPEGYRPDGSGGVVAHTLQLLDALERLREAAPLDNLLRSKMQVARTAVVAQPLPLAQHLVFGCGRQRLHRRPAAHEPLPVGPPLLHLRLLQNDL